MKKDLLIFVILSCSNVLAAAQGLQQAGFTSHAGDIWKWDTIIGYNPFTVTEENQMLIQTFNSDGSVASKTIRIMANLAWQNYSRSGYAYNALDGTVIEFNQLWQSGVWVDDTRNTLSETIGTGEFVFTKLTEALQSGTWVKTWRSTHTINTSLIFTDLLEQWVNNAWVNISSTTSWTDILNLQYGQDCQVWDGSKWVNSWKDIYTVNFFLDVQSVLHQVWNGSDWVNQAQYLYTNNDAGYPTRILRQECHSGAWADSARTTWTYDGNNNSLTGNYEVWTIGAWRPDLGTMKIYYSGSTYDYFHRDQIDNANRYTAKYAATPSGIDGPGKDDRSLSVYPDPAEGYLNLDYKNFKSGDALLITICDLQGRQMLQMPVTAEKTLIDLNGFTSGLYLIRFDSKKTTLRAHFLKR